MIAGASSSVTTHSPVSYVAVREELVADEPLDLGRGVEPSYGAREAHHHGPLAIGLAHPSLEAA
jgi:hypothetical protein